MKVHLLIAFLTFICFCCLGENNAQILRQHPPVVSEGEQTHTKLQQENRALKAVIQKLELIFLRNIIAALSKQIVALKENNIAHQDTIAILKKNNGLYAARIEELNRCIQEQNKKNLELEKRLADSLEVVKQLQIQLDEKNATLRDKQKALKDRNTLLHKKNKLYISLFYAILLLVILWITAKFVHRIKRFTFRHHKSLETDFIEPQTMDSKKDEEITIVDSLADDAKELKCPRCGWKYNPGDKVCKNCTTIF